MTEADARYAVGLLDARADLADVRKGLGLEGGCVVLKLTAFEGDRDGGSHHGSALVPLRLAPQIIAFAEDLIRRQLRALKVMPEGESATPTKSERGVKGGRARMAALSPARRSEIARTAAEARWAKAGA